MVTIHNKSNAPGNEKPIAQHVQGNQVREWRVSDDRNSIVEERRTISLIVPGPSAGTFILGGMETTRDELADYLLEAAERNTSGKRPDRLPDIQRKIERAREKHAAAIKAAVGWKKEGYQLPKHTKREQRRLALPQAVYTSQPDGRLLRVG